MATRILLVSLTTALLLPALPVLAAEDVRDDVEETPPPVPSILVRGGLRVLAPEDERVEVSGLTGRGYLGTLELLPRGDGIEVVNDVSFDTYLYGLAEVPRSWPRAVLEAQVIAARTYAWYVMNRSSYADYDICATVACQVFVGADVLRGQRGERWRRAVDSTSGLVLRYEGEPILARYFSTSGGRTYPNEYVFPSSGPRPYLVGFEDSYDSLSPLHRWEVRFSRAQFDEMAARGTTLADVVPITAIERLGAIDDPRALLKVTGGDGRSVEITAIALRDFVSRLAPELWPEEFPSLRISGGGRLPSTVPTTRYAIEVGPGGVVLRGLGWGHGVGMGQWGAHARALEGASASEILAAYFGGLTPEPAAGVPRRIRAGMGRATLDVDGAMRLTLHRPTRLEALDGSALGLTLGTWRVARATDAAGRVIADTLELFPPRGQDDPVALTDRGTTVSDPRPQDGLLAGQRVTQRLEVSRPVLLRLEVRAPDGTVVSDRSLGLVEHDRPDAEHLVVWWAQDVSGRRLPEGPYALRLTATDSDGERTTLTTTAPIEDPSPGFASLGLRALLTAGGG